jgi:hypothetical protein
MSAQAEKTLDCSARPRWGRELGSRVAVSVAAACLVPVGALGFAACGGTTGRPDPVAMESDDGGEGGADAPLDSTVDASSEAGDDSAQAFDTTIQYADQVLPDVAPFVEGGVEAATVSLPNCPPDLQAIYLPDGAVVPVDAGNASLGALEIPAAYAADGTQVPAPPGTPCATQVWTTSADCDQCLRTMAWGNADWAGSVAGAELPPCSDLVDAGNASVGPGNGRPLYTLCRELFDCYMQTRCFWGADGMDDCWCNEDQAHCLSNGGDGVCYAQELAAFQAPPATPYQMIINLSGRIDPASPAHAASSVDQVFNDITTVCAAACRGDAGGDP